MSAVQAIDAYVCRHCGHEFSSVSSTSFLGFTKASCPECSKVTHGPLRGWARIGYWIFALTAFTGLPLLFIPLIAYALFKDYQLRK